MTLGEVEGQRNGKEVTVAALIVGVRPMRSRKGARWAIYTIQDMTGIQEMLAFPEAFGRLEPMLKPRVPLLLKVRVQVEESGNPLIPTGGALGLEGLAEPAGPWPACASGSASKCEDLSEELPWIGCRIFWRRTRGRTRLL